MNFQNFFLKNALFSFYIHYYIKIQKYLSNFTYDYHVIEYIGVR